MNKEEIDKASVAVRMKYALDLHGYMREYIKNADQKAVFFFSICSALLAFQYSQGWSAKWIKPIGGWTILDLLALLTMLGLLISSACFLSVVAPRLGGASRGYIFFRSVAGFDSPAQFANEVSELSEEQLSAAWLQHCHEIAQVTTAKYQKLSVGLRMASVSIFSSLALFLINLPVEGILGNAQTIQRDSGGSTGPTK